MMKKFIYTKEPSEAHKEAIMRIEELFEDICSCGQVNFRVLDKSKRWKEWNKIGHVFFERPDILDEVREIFTCLQIQWNNKDGTVDIDALRQWLHEYADEIEADDDFDDDIDSEAYGFYLDTDLAMYAIVVDMSGACSVCPECAIFAKDKRYLCDQRTAEKHLETAAHDCGDLAFAREACYYLLSQLPDDDTKTKQKLKSSINTLNIVLRG